MIKVDKLTKYYGDKKGIENVSFSLKGGEIMGVIGTNGSGKTTTFKCLLQLLKPDSGTILVDKKELSELDNTYFGYLPEEKSLYPDISVSEQLKFYGKLKHLDEESLDNQISFWLKRLDIEDYYHRKIRELSKGNQQKVQLIASLLHDPKIIIFDEPMTGLDVVNRELFKEIIYELSTKKKIILLSSHQSENIEEFFDKILYLQNGDPVFYGTISKLKHISENVYIKINLTSNQKFYLRNGVIHQKRKGKITYLLMENEEKAKSLAKELLDEYPLSSLTIEFPSINDIISERKWL